MNWQNCIISLLILLHQHVQRIGKNFIIWEKSSTFYVKEADSGNYVKGLGFAAVSDQCINAMDTILLQIYECFMKNDYKPWEQLSLSVKNTGDFDVKYQYDVMEKSEYGQAERETIWAYETFGWKPGNSPFLMNI